MFHRKMIVGIVLLLLIVAFVVFGFLMGFLGTPSVTGIQNSWGEIREDTSEIKTEVDIYNPNPFGITLSNLGIDYKVLMNDITMGESSKRGIGVKKGNSTISITTLFNNTKMPQWWITHLRNDENTTVRIAPRVFLDLGFTKIFFAVPDWTTTFKTDLLAQMNIDEPRGVYFGSTGITIKSVSPNWGEVSEETTEINTEMVIYNPNLAVMPMTRIDCTVQMNDVMVATGSTENLAILEAGKDTTVTFITAIINERLDDWFVTHLRNGEHTTVIIDAYAVLEFAGSQYRICLISYESEIETDLLGSRH